MIKVTFGLLQNGHLGLILYVANIPIYINNYRKAIMSQNPQQESSLPPWIRNGDHHKVYFMACYFGASAEVLSDKSTCEVFVDNKINSYKYLDGNI